MVRFLIIVMCALLIGSCQTRKSKGSFDEIADFGLAGDGAGTKVDDKAYFDDLKRSEASVSFESSLPLPLMVAKTGDPFDSVPPGGKPGAESRLSVQVGPCRFTLLSGPLQVDRYLLAGQWIKLTEGLPAKVPVKLDANMDLNLKILTKLAIEIPSSQLPICRKMFEGKKFFLGRYHLNKSRIGLIAGKNSPPIQFGSRSLDPQGKMVFMHWQSGAAAPILIDDFDFPATAESGIFRTTMGPRGFYYLAFQTVLRLDGMDKMIVKLPYNGATVPAATPRNPVAPANRPGAVPTQVPGRTMPAQTQPQTQKSGTSNTAATTQKVAPPQAPVKPKRP